MARGRDQWAAVGVLDKMEGIGLVVDVGPVCGSWRWVCSS